jgi:AraC-like DNA-binding protein
MSIEKRQNSSLSELYGLVQQLMPKAERRETSFPGLILSRLDEISDWQDCFYETQAILMLSGAKEVVLGREHTTYSAGDCLVSSVDLPARVRIIKAPCVAIVLHIDGKDIASLLERIKPEENLQNITAEKSFNDLDYSEQTVAKADEELVQTFSRLTRSVVSSSDMTLAQFAKDELIYRLAIGPWGGKLRSFYAKNAPNSQISLAIDYLKKHYTQPLSVPRLAAHVNMAESTFYRRFLAITGISPLQFLKRLRLCAAQRMLLSGKENVSGAGYQVGYENPSNFSRDYRRFFGTPPKENLLRKSA